MRIATILDLCVMLALVGGGAGRPEREPTKTDVAKEAEAWAYPGAKHVGTGGAAGRIYQIVQTTPDAMEAVLKHYDKKCGTSLAGECPPGVFDTGSEVAGGKVISTLSADDSTVPVAARAKGTPRGIMLRQLTRDEPGFLVTVLVTRTPGDAQTHLLITYLKR